MAIRFEVEDIPLLRDGGIMNVVRRSAMATLKFPGVLMLLSLSILNVAYAIPTSLSEFTVTSVDGQQIKLSDQKGKWILVNYWATWCGDCLAEIPALSKLATDEPRIVVIGLTDENLTPQQWKKFLSKHPVSYPVASVHKVALPKEIPATAYGLSMRPISYLIGPAGKVIERSVGAVDIEKLELRINEHQR